MQRVSYLKNEEATLYLVATPIGNLSETNNRLITTLQLTKYILCEDTRVTSKLLHHLNIIDKKLISYYKENEYAKLSDIITLIKQEKQVALLSDAGYPLLSDPGFNLVNQAIAEGINIVVINGANALLPALLTSGFKPIPFTFLGFLDHKSKKSCEQLLKYQHYYHTLVIYESTHRYKQTLNNILQVFGNVEISIARELTKLNEEIIRGHIKDVILLVTELKGEIVIAINNQKHVEEDRVSDEYILQLFIKYVNNKMSKKDSIKKVAKELGIEKNYVYALVHNRNSEDE